jgi:hypothetical protein
MAFDVIAGKFPKDDDFTPRARALSLLLRVIAPELEGGIYDLPKAASAKKLYPFHQEWEGKRYITLMERKPNIPEGTNTIRSQIVRQGQMLFGAATFPAIETSNDAARSLLNGWIDQADVADRMREAVLIGSVGSMAFHLKALSDPKVKNQPHRVYLEAHTTRFLVPTFNPYRPDELLKVTEKYKLDGESLAADGYAIDPRDFNQIFWFMREWDINSEIWYVPWKVSDEKTAAKTKTPFVPVVDYSEGKTTDHKLGFCPWEWVKNLPLGRGIDGSCQFAAALDHAVNLDYLESQIAAAVKYTMSPTMVIAKPKDAQSTGDDDTETNDGAGFVSTPSTILTIDAEGKAYYLEISGEGIEKARLVAADLRRAIIEAVYGDRVDPKDVTMGHQGAQSLKLLNQPLIGVCDQLKQSYGSAFKRVLKMVLKIVESRSVEVNDVIINGVGPVTDLALNFGSYYTDTPSEKYADAQAADLNMKNGLLSRDRAMNNIATTYNIPNIAAEVVKVAQDQKASDERAAALAQATAQVKVSDSI